jgi:hypothetical protein
VAGGQPGPGCLAGARPLRPLERVGKIAMGITMGYMLVLMLW